MICEEIDSCHRIVTAEDMTNAVMSKNCHSAAVTTALKTLKNQFFCVMLIMDGKGVSGWMKE